MTTWTDAQIEVAKARYDAVVTRVQKRRILLVMAYLVGRKRRRNCHVTGLHTNGDPVPRLNWIKKRVSVSQADYYGVRGAEWEVYK